VDPRERTYDPLVTQRTLLRGWQAGIWTALPGVLQSFDPAKQTAVVQPAVKAQVQDRSTMVWSDVQLPLCLDCPVVFPSGGGYLLSFPLKSGNEGLLVFASRCIDSWWQSGGVQRQAEVRFHDLSDGFFIPGCSSIPNVPENLDPDKLQLRNLAGTLLLELNSEDQSCRIVAAGGVTIEGNLHVTGEITWPHGVIGGADAAVAITGSLTATEDITAGKDSGDQIGLRSHTHPTPMGESGAPTPNT